MWFEYKVIVKKVMINLNTMMMDELVGFLQAHEQVLRGMS